MSISRWLRSDSRPPIPTMTARWTKRNYARAPVRYCCGFCNSIGTRHGFAGRLLRPTLAETVPGYEASVSFGLFAAAGTPTDVIKKVNADVQNIVSDLEFQNNY